MKSLLICIGVLLTTYSSLGFSPSVSLSIRSDGISTDSQLRADVSSSRGDPLRDATGIRPSLHPTTINAIADALKSRAMNTDGCVFRVSDTVQPIEVALTAGKIAATAIKKRQESSKQDGMTLTPKEEQAIAGRILGVVMRFDALEQTLFEVVSQVGWVAKYNDWATFGVLQSEDKEDESGTVEERLREDPLFRVSRAECLLAIFLKTIEIPQLANVKESVADDSKIDFLDADRFEVLCSEN